MMYNEDFWAALEKLVNMCEVIIDRPKGSRHPRYKSIVYPVDYGFLKGTTSGDGAEIDVWRGSDPGAGIDAIICTLDLIKRDSEIKILIGCNEEDKKTVYDFHNENEFMKGIMIRRE